MQKIILTRLSGFKGGATVACVEHVERLRHHCTHVYMYMMSSCGIGWLTSMYKKSQLHVGLDFKITQAHTGNFRWKYDYMLHAGHDELHLACLGTGCKIQRHKMHSVFVYSWYSWYLAYNTYSVHDVGWNHEIKTTHGRGQSTCTVNSGVCLKHVKSERK